jgi:hypothetical protein
MSAKTTPSRTRVSRTHRASAAANPRIEITPSAEQYDQLCRDLAALRKAGAHSNTAAVLAAVHVAAAAKLAGG